MSDYGAQRSESDLKIIDKIEVKHRPPSFEQKKENNAQVSYLHAILDKFQKDLNNEFVPRLDDILNDNKGSISRLSANLEVEKSNLNNLMKEIGNSDEGLIKKLNDLQKEIEQLKSKTSGGGDIDINEGDWGAPQFKGTDNEFM